MLVKHTPGALEVKHAPGACTSLKLFISQTCSCTIWSSTTWYCTIWYHDFGPKSHKSVVHLQVTSMTHRRMNRVCSWKLNKMQQVSNTTHLHSLSLLSLHFNSIRCILDMLITLEYSLIYLHYTYDSSVNALLAFILAFTIASKFMRKKIVFVTFCVYFLMSVFQTTDSTMHPSANTSNFTQHGLHELKLCPVV